MEILGYLDHIPIYKIEPFGTPERIQELMNDKGYTQETLAEKINVDARSVRRWINEGVKPKKNLVDLAIALDCDPDYLLCNQDIPKIDPSKNKKRIKLSKTPNYAILADIIKDLFRDTEYSFSCGINSGSKPIDEKEIVIVSGESKYYGYELVLDYEFYHYIKFNDQNEIKLTEAQLEGFIMRLMKRFTLDFEIERDALIEKSKK